MSAIGFIAIAAGIAALACGLAAIGMGLATSRAAEAIARQPEAAEVRHRGDAAAEVGVIQTARARLRDDFVVLVDEFVERVLVDVAHHRHHHAVRHLHRHAEVDALGRQNAIADHVARALRELRQRQRQRAHEVERDARLAGVVLAVQHDGRHVDRAPRARNRAAPGALHAARDAATHRRGLARRPAVHVVEEVLEVVNRDAPAGSRAADVAEIGLRDAQLVHARADARREVMGPSHPEGHRQASALGRCRSSAARRFAVLALGAEVRSLGVAAAGRGGRRSRHRRAGGLHLLERLSARALHLLLAGLDDAQHAAHGNRLALAHRDALHGAAADAGDAHHGLVRLHFKHFLLGRHHIPRGNQPVHDGGFCNGLAQLGHQNRYFRHD